MMQQVEIRVKGQIDERWSEWLDGLTITHTSGGETLLSGSVMDQSALYGVLARLRDLGLPLLSVNPGENNTERLSP
jgi:hypothetical protein